MAAVISKSRRVCQRAGWLHLEVTLHTPSWWCPRDWHRGWQVPVCAVTAGCVCLFLAVDFKRCFGSGGPCPCCCVAVCSVCLPADLSVTKCQPVTPDY